MYSLLNESTLNICIGKTLKKIYWDINTTKSGGGGGGKRPPPTSKLGRPYEMFCTEIYKKLLC